MNKKAMIGLVFLAIACVLIAPQAEAVYYEETAQIGEKIDYTFIGYASDTVFAHSKISMQSVKGKSVNSSALLSFETEPEKTDLTFKYGFSVNQAKEADIAQNAKYTSFPRSARLRMNISSLSIKAINASVESSKLDKQLKFFGKNTSQASIDMYYKDGQVGAKWIIAP